MSEQEILAGLTEIFRELFADDSLMIGPSTTADDVEGWDSIKHINLIVAVEDHFGIAIATSEIDGLKNVGDLLQVIAAKAG